MRRREFIAAMPAPLLAHGGLQAVRVDSDGMLVIDGERRFITGVYQLPKVEDPWREVKEAGFDVVHLGSRQEEFATAHANGLYGWTGVGSISPANRLQDEARIRKTVLALKDHPALLFWETEDEPAYQWKKPGPRVPPDNIIAAYEAVKRLDPLHPLYLNHAPTNLVSTLRQYNRGADIIATDIYPVIPHGIREEYALWPDGMQGDLLNTYLSQVGQYTDKARAVAGASRAVFMVLQAFAWEDLRGKDRDPRMVLYPSRSELRFMAYNAIVRGANGVLYWGPSFTPAGVPLWQGLKATTQELRQIRTELSAPLRQLPLSLTYHEVGHDVDLGIQWIVKPSHTGVLLIAVNADRYLVDVSFSGLQQFKRVEALFERRTPSFSAGKFRDSFDPFGVHVYRIEP